MFQVLTQKGWVDVMHYTMLYSIQDLAPFVAIYFIVYHLAINLVRFIESINEKKRKGNGFVCDVIDRFVPVRCRYFGQS